MWWIDLCVGNALFSRISSVSIFDKGGGGDVDGTWRDGDDVWMAANGRSNEFSHTTSSQPFATASVSKLNGAFSSFTLPDDIGEGVFKSWRVIVLVAFSALFNPTAAWLFMLRIFLYISHSGMSGDVGLDVWRKKYTNGYREQTFKLGVVNQKQRAFIH